MREFDSFAGLSAQEGDFDAPANWTARIVIRPIAGFLVGTDGQQMLYGGREVGRKPVQPGGPSAGDSLGR